MTFKLFLMSLSLLYFYTLIFLKSELSRIFTGALVLSAIIIGSQLLFRYITRKFPVRCFIYLTLLWLLTGYMLLVSIFQMIGNVGNYSISTVIQDLISIIVLSSGAVLIVKNNDNEKNLVKYLKFIGIIAIFSGIISFSYADFSLGREENVWKPQYIWWGFLFPWSYLLLYKVIMKKNTMFWNIAAYGTTVMYLILGLLFGKRVVLFDLAIILFVIAIATRKKSLMLKILQMGAVIICLLITVIFASRYIFDLKILNLLDTTLLRFTSDSIKEFDRFKEFIDLLAEYSYSIIATGAGLGSYHSGPGGINLHIGWLNFIFKGGIIYFGLELWVFILSIKTLFKSKEGWEKFIASCVVFSYMAILISSSWVASPITMNFSVIKFELLRVIDANRLEETQTT